ncbi:tetratricopeptide repeat protein [Blastopirellula marina]|uniref:Uncharacterized protein n=1 Tax=Blastopirellula marina DSM 3645 TaxID=314230 RepID=A3ZSS2_9BACT|nr:tetratricopeptide repeat protein [Blastopirellula marina]EAQ80346.1 hypothetical protein DSM3645_10892 [Blastopirellula marina DSM 3645]
MTRNVVSASAVAALLWLGNPCVVSAQEPIVVELYGQGVHQFNRGEMSEAFITLSTAIDQGSKDPRAYYFRGLALWNLGRPEQAELDFEEGAKLELTTDRSFAIGKSLERVQGSARLKLEDYRQKIRVQEFIARKQWERQRYELLKQAEEEVLRGAAPASATLPVEPKASDPTDPFGSGEAVSPGAPTPTPPTTPAEPATPASEDPFGSSAEPAMPAPMNDDPFGSPTTPTEDPFAAPTKPAMESAPGAPATNDPFDAGAGTTPAPNNVPEMENAEATPSLDDPFGGSAKPAMDDPFAAPTKPAMESAPGAPATNDPFDAGAGTTPAPNNVPEMEDAEATPSLDDPFGGSAKPAMDDPFAAPTKPAMESAPGAPATNDPFDAGAGTTPAPNNVPEMETAEAGRAPLRGTANAMEGAAAAGGSTTRVVGAAISAIGSAFTPKLKTPSVPGLSGPSAPASDDPFAAPADMKPAASDDPFGASPAPASDDPFATPASDDPFGATPPAAMKPAPANDDPFAAPASDDPFGAAPAKEMEAKPAAGSSDPFADPFAN